MRGALRIVPLILVIMVAMVPLATDNVRAETYGDFEYTVSDGTVKITKYVGSGGSVTIPSEINGMPVTSIGERVFYYCSKLTTIDIPDSVTSIGSRAFYECSYLTNINTLTVSLASATTRSTAAAPLPRSPSPTA